MSAFQTILARRDFLRLWLGQIISSVGDRFYQFALLSLILGLNEGSQVGKESARIVFIGMLPGLLFAPVFGWIVDHFDRRHVMIACDGMRVVLVAVLIYVWFHAQNLAVVYLLVFLIGAMSCLFIPARQSLVPQLVHSHELVPANALISLIGVIASLVGGISAGLLSAIFGARLSFILTILGFAVSAWFIARIEKRPVVVEAEEESSWRHHFKSMLGGASYLREQPGLAGLILLASLFSFVSGFFAVTVLEYTVTNLSLDFVAGLAGHLAGLFALVAPKPPVFDLKMLALGLLFIGLGAGLGLGVWTSSWLKRFSHWKWLTLVAIFGNGVGILLFAHVTDYRVAWLLCAWLGWCGALWMIPLEARLQHEVPDQTRGRVFALRTVATTLAFMLALALNLSGDLLRWLGPAPLIQGLGLALMAISILVMLVRRREAREFWG